MFSSNRDGPAALFSKLVDTPGEAEPVMAGREGTGFIEPGETPLARMALFVRPLSDLEAPLPESGVGLKEC